MRKLLSAAPRALDLTCALLFTFDCGAGTPSTHGDSSAAGGLGDAGILDAGGVSPSTPSSGASGTSAALAISPSTAVVIEGTTQAFTCSVSGAPATCSWQVVESGGGNVSATGIYTAPTGAGTYHVVATSAGSATATAVVSIVAPVVGSCANLDPVGTWKNITPSAFTSPSNLETTTVAVDPQHPGVLYASAGNKTNGGNGSLGVFKSTDCGASWAKISEPGSPLETGDVWQLFVDPSDPQTLYATNGYGNNPTLYKSTNGGAHWLPLPVNFEGGVQIRSGSMDPTNPKHLVVCMHGPCNIASNPLCLGETLDGGNSWTTIQGPPIAPADQGADGGGPMIVGGASIYYLHPSAGVWYTNNAGKTWVKHFQWYNYPANKAPNSFDSMYPVTYGPPGLGYVGSKGLYVSFGFTGIFEIASPYDPASLKASDWTFLSGSPPTASGPAMIDDGASLYASSLNDNSGKSYYSAPLDAGTPWHQMAPAGGIRGAGTFSYDRGHHTIYSANWGAGLWRLVSH